MAQTSNDIRAELEPETAVDPQSQELREEMAATRAALTDKLGMLQDRVEGTVEAVQAAGAQAVEAIKHIVDLKYQVDQRPWLMVGASLLAGYALGQLGRGRTPDRTSAGTNLNGAADGSRSRWAAPPPRPAERQQPSLKNRLLDLFDEELGKLQSVAIGAAMGMIRDWLKVAVPALAPQIHEVLNTATCKLGGEPPQNQLEAHEAALVRSNGLTSNRPGEGQRPQATDRRD